MPAGNINKQHFSNEEIRTLLGKALYDGYRTSAVRRIVPDGDGWTLFIQEYDRHGNEVWQEGYQQGYNND